MSALEEHFSWRTAMLSIGVVDLLAAIAFVMLLPPSRRFVKRTDLTLRHHLRLWHAQLQHGRLPFVFAIGFLVMGAFVTIYNYAGFRLMAAPFNLSPTACGLIFGAYLFGMVSSSSAGALADRLGRAPVLVSGIVVFAAGSARSRAPRRGMRLRCICSPTTSGRACSARSAARSGNAARGRASPRTSRCCSSSHCWRRGG
jgi:YNFM family putative membrane transporter